MGTEGHLSSSERWEMLDSVAVLTIDRAAKRNALDEAMIQAVADFCRRPPDGVGAIVARPRG